jgi:C-terminal processing protease CtpA/Prc
MWIAFKYLLMTRCGALHVGDILLAVNGDPVSRLTVDAVNRLTREEPGSSLRLEVLPGAVARSRGSVRENTYNNHPSYIPMLSTTRC